MSLNVNGLTSYVDENKMPLIKKSILEGRTLSLISVQPDIKSTAMINIIDSTLVAQAGSCGWNESGTTTLTQRELSVCPIKINESICLDTLESYYTQTMMKPGSYNEDIPFEQIYAEQKAEQVNALIEDIVWKGDVDGGSGSLALCDGFIELISGLTSSVDGNIGTASTIDSTNVVDIFDGMIESIPSDIIDSDDLVIFCGYDVYRTYATALRNANLFHYNGQENQGQDFSQLVPGSNVRVIAVRGLNGTNKMYASRLANFYAGVDMLNDAEEFKIWFSEDNDEVRFKSKFKIGVNVAFPEFVVYFVTA